MYIWILKGSIKMHKENLLGEGRSFYKLLNKDIRELNGIVISLFSLLFLVGVGFVSYKISNSYALFGDSITGSNTIGVEASLPSAADTIIAKVGTDGLEEISHIGDNTLQSPYDQDTIEYRYRGANPSNYVSFNDELWRIIGVFPTDDGTGNIENRIKIIRNDAIGTYAWDNEMLATNNFNNNINITVDDLVNNPKQTIQNSHLAILPPCGGGGDNNWNTSTLQSYLNNDYYNSLTIESQNMIGNTKYYLGGYNDVNITKEEIYSYERKISGEDYYLNNNPSNIVSKIAILYTSDYGYAASDVCTQVIYDYDNSECINNNWFSSEMVNQSVWTLTPYSDASSFVYNIDSSGSVYTYHSEMCIEYNASIYPVLSLKSTIQIKSGSGTETSPYILG